MDVNVDQFLRDGVFGVLALGATELDVLRALGSPDRFADHNKPIPLRMAVYDSVEMTYIDGGLVEISLNLPVRGRGDHARLTFSGLIPLESVQFEEFKTTLSKLTIPYSVDAPRSFPEDPVLATGERGTRVFFVKNKVASMALTDDDAFLTAGRKLKGKR